MRYGRGLHIVLLHVRRNEEEKTVERRAFLRSSGLEEQDLRSVDALRGAPGLSLLDSAGGLIIGGSGYSVFEDVPNCGAMTALVRAAGERGTPTLGVCFGAQLIAAAYGGEVVRDKEREEVGTYRLRRSPEGAGDALFDGVPDAFDAQCAHHDRIARVPEGAIVLAASDQCAVQAFRMPRGRMYGVQFHPERSKADFQWSISRRMTDHGGDADMLDAAYQGLRETPDAQRVVKRFVALSVRIGSRLPRAA